MKVVPRFRECCEGPKDTGLTLKGFRVRYLEAPKDSGFRV